MKFLVDMDISLKAATFLRKLKYDAVHLHEQGFDTLTDSNILEKAFDEGRILLTHDLGFGELIAKSNARLPSIIIFRLRNMSSENVNLYLKEIISNHAESLRQGVIICATENQFRIRVLPIKTRQ